MFAWLSSLWRDRSGVSLVEFAFVAPILLTMLYGTIEVGRVFFQANAVERGLRGAALFAARSPWPLSTADQTTVLNLARTGNETGTGHFLADGWAEPGSDFNIASANFPVGTDVIPIIRVSAAVPFKPLMPGLLESLGLASYTIRMSHQQAYIGE